MTATTQDAENILKELKEAGQRMTKEEIHKQRVSFIMGMVGRKGGIDRDYIEAELKKLSGIPSEK